MVVNVASTVLGSHLQTLCTLSVVVSCQISCKRSTNVAPLILLLSC